MQPPQTPGQRITRLRGSDGFAREAVAEILGGEAASLREAPLPPDPSLPKSGWRLRCAFLRRGFRLRGDASPIGGAVVTAADRAAATCRRGGCSEWMMRGACSAPTGPQAGTPNAARPRRLCQPPWTQPSLSETCPLSGGTNSEKSSHPKRQPLFGREGSGGRGASLREAASPPRISRIPLFFCKFDN